jgi:hypothetical protein
VGSARALRLHINRRGISSLPEPWNKRRAKEKKSIDKMESKTDPKRKHFILWD